MSNATNDAFPCINPPGMNWQEEMIHGDGNTWSTGAIFQFQENANVRNRVIGNPVLIRMPLTTDVSLCGEPSINVFGIVYRYGISGNTSVGVTTGGGVNAGGSGTTNISYDFPFPVDMAISMGSFNCTERFFLRTPCDEFIAGNGSNLPSSPTGYGANANYCDNNQGGSIAIYRNVTQVRVGFQGAGGLSCGAHPRFLKTHNIFRKDVKDGTAIYPPPQAVLDAIGAWKWRGQSPQITIPV